MKSSTKTIQDLLEHYNEIQQYITNVNADIEDCQRMLDLEAAPKSPCLSAVGGSGGEKCSSEEKDVFHREKLQTQLENYREELDKIEPTFNRLKRSLESLKSFDFIQFRILKVKYIQGKTWDAASYYSGLPNSTCRSQADMALYRLSIMVFGFDDIPEQLSLDFLQS